MFEGKFYIQGINPSLGLAVLKSADQLSLVKYPYTSTIPITQSDAAKLFDLDNWIPYGFKPMMGNREALEAFMTHEFLAGFFHELIAMEKSVYQGGVCRDSHEVKLEKILDRITKIEAKGFNPLKLMTLLNGMAYTLSGTPEQMICLEQLRQTIESKSPDLSIIPLRKSGLSGGSKFDFDSFYRHILEQMEKQKRFKQAMNIIQYFSLNAEEFSDSFDFKADYDRLREMDAEKKGYSTRMSFKKGGGNIKKYR